VFRGSMRTGQDLHQPVGPHSWSPNREGYGGKQGLVDGRHSVEVPSPRVLQAAPLPGRALVIYATGHGACAFQASRP